ncbi:MAG TPA: DUF4097 family beta strand repeat-containing protein [Gammaproteobacteria bacterium]|nr:DUF4097 family beta strand repeat-containing protein [Gammaproteobacteria bacterium]
MKRIMLVLTYSLVSFVAAVCLFTVMMLVANSAYAYPGRDGSINQTLSAAPNATVRINNVAGSIKVLGWDKNQVQVTGTLSDGVTLDFHNSGNGVEIRAVYPENSHDNAEADLTIQVPAASRLSVNTVSADILVSGVNGRAQLESVSGDVTLDSHASDISARSVSGEVSITGSAPGAHILGHSISGYVKISGVDGDVQAESISGTVKVFQSRLDRARLGSTSGSVAFSAALAKSGSYTFNSTSGNLSLAFPKAPDARFDIYTFSGDIDNNFGPKAQHTSEYGPGMELHFTNGTGSAQVTAHTLSGNITLGVP